MLKLAKINPNLQLTQIYKIYLGKISLKNKCPIDSNWDHNDDLIDPISHEVINDLDVYNLNGRCYNPESIRLLLSASNNAKDPFTREPISKDIYEEFNIENTQLMSEDYDIFNNVYDSKYRFLNLSLKNINSEFLKNFRFPLNLKYLSLIGNNIRNLNEIVFPSSLIFLNLSINPIDYSLGFGNLLQLKNLSILYLYETNINSHKIQFQNNIEFGNSLNYLYLNDNPINYSLGLGNMSKLENLDLLSLNRTNINYQIIKFPNNIIILSLIDNNIKTLNNFQFFNSLKKLYLFNNPVCQIQPRMDGIEIIC